MPLSEYLKALKTKKNLTAAEIAQKSGISISSISRILSGENDNPSWQTIVPIFKIMGGSMDAAAGIQSEDAAQSAGMVAVLQQRIQDLKENVAEYKEQLEEERKARKEEHAILESERRENRTLRRVIIGLIVAFVLMFYLFVDSRNPEWGIFQDATASVIKMFGVG